MLHSSQRSVAWGWCLAGLLFCLLVGGSLAWAGGEPESDAPDKPAAEKVELPGIKIDVKNKRVDVQGKVCLDEGLLEVIACTADTKEHESIVVVEAVPMHIHAALLLIGADSGNPAMVKPANEEKTQWLHLPPRGDAVAISLVYPDPEDKEKTIERPISDFIKRAERDPGLEEDEGEEENDDSATVFKTFLFAGSLMVEGPDGERQYAADGSGNVVSISTFGDEVLCLPSRQSQDNAALAWEINGEHLPEAGAAVTLRLTLQTPADAADAADAGE